MPIAAHPCLLPIAESSHRDAVVHSQFLEANPYAVTFGGPPHIHYPTRDLVVDAHRFADERDPQRIPNLPYIEGSLERWLMAYFQFELKHAKMMAGG